MKINKERIQNLKKYVKFWHLLLLLLFITIFSVLSFNTRALTPPHIERVGPNKVSNPSVSGTTNWAVGGDAIYDASVSRSSGSGSLRLQTPYGLEGSSSVVSGLIPVTPGKTYTFAVYSKSDVKSNFAQYYAEHDASGNYRYNGDGTGVMQSTTNQWEESVIFITPAVGTASIELKMVRNKSVNDTGYIWLDDFYFGEGVGFEQPPSPKVPFNGSITRVDALGNMEINKSGTWTPFFPICVYASSNRTNFSVYSERGFNCNMWAGAASTVQLAKNAVSAFNPDGMYSGRDVTGYLDIRSAPEYNIQWLIDDINNLKTAGLMDHLLFWYDDHEDYVGYPLSTINTLKSLDIDANGNRMHPIYMLQGNYGIARGYEKDGFSDIIGAYVSGEEPPNSLTVQKNIEKQTNPVVFAQLNLYGANGLSSTTWRKWIYDALLSGAKGLGWWMDCVDCGSWGADYGLVPFEQTGLYPILPDIRREIDALMPIIREPDWTDWSFTSSNGSIKFGTREHSGEGYIITINTSSSPITTTFSTSDLPYTPTQVNDYFTGNKLTTYANSRFTITIPANGTAVYQLVKNTTVVVPPPVGNQTYYVSPSGNDTSPGTSSAPFKTIQKAADIVNPGDTVIVRDGTYSTTGYNLLVISTSGTASAPITFKSEHKWGAILDGANQQSSYGIIFNNNVAYVNLIDFEIRNFKDTGIHMNNFAAPNSYITIKGNHIHDIGRWCNNIAPEDQYGLDGVYMSGGNNIVFEGNIINNIGRFASGENGCVINSSRPYYQNHDHGLYLNGVHNVSIRNNIFYSNQRGWSIQLYDKPTDNVSIVNNVFAYGNPYREGAHIILWGNLTNVNIKNNVFYGASNFAVSTYFTGYTWTNIVANNNLAFATDNTHMTVFDQVTPGTILANNILNTDPKMVSPTSQDFKLQAGSPAINAGVNVGLTTDYLGNAIVGLPDIGAYETSVVNTPTTYSLNITGANGTVTKSPNKATYTSGEQVTLTPSPATGYQFTSWAGDATGSANPLSVTINSNKNITANFTAIPTGAKTYYVSPTGSNTASGTSSAPFKTIQKAADIVNPGDTVIIRDGVYTTTEDWFIYLIRSGTAENPITFKSEHKWGAILDGQNIAHYGVILYVGASYINFVDLEIKNVKTGYTSTDDQHLSNYITIQGNKIHDLGTNLDMSVDYPQGIYIERGDHHWNIDKNLIYNIGSKIPSNYWLNKAHAVYVGYPESAGVASHHINITNNVMFGISGTALNICSNNDLIANNIFAWSNENNNAGGGNNLVTMDGPGVYNETIANNIFYQPPTKTPYALLSYSGYNGWVVKNNMVYGGRMWEPYSYTSANNATMAGNNYCKTDCEKGEVNPLFVSAIKANAPNVDFKLQAGSPAINAGVNVGLTTDYLGNAIVGLPDIGAYETSVVNTPTAYSLNITIPTNGTITKSPNKTSYTSGESVTLTATPNTLYRFKNWTGDYSSTTNPLTIAVSSNKSLSAVFELIPLPNYTLTTSATNGSISKNPSSSTYIEGSTVAVTATANTGYRFNNWTGSITSSTNPVSLTMNSNKSITANFTIIPLPTVNVTTLSSSIGYGASTTISWTSTNATSCSSTSNTGTSTTGSFSTGALTSNRTYTVSCTGPGGTSTDSVNITVAPAPSGTLTSSTTSCTISSGNSTCTIPFSWNTSNSIGTSAITRSGSQTNIKTGNIGTNVSFTIPYGSSTYYLYNNSTKLAEVSVTASCSSGSSWDGGKCALPPANTYTLVVNTNGGTVTKNPNKTSYTEGESVTLTATANQGYSFTNWVGNATGTNVSVIISMTSNKTVTANFTSNPSGTLTSSTTSCTISSGNSNCTIPFSWNTSNPIGTSAITRSGATTNIATGNTGTNVSFTIPYGSSTYYLYNNSTKLAEVSVTSSCSSGSSWDGGKCELIPIDTYTVETTGINGSIKKTPDDISYQEGTVVTLKADPDSGYQFSSWTGDVVESNNPIQITVNKNKKVTANFVLSPISQGGGSSGSHRAGNIETKSALVPEPVIETTSNESLISKYIINPISNLISNKKESDTETDTNPVKEKTKVVISNIPTKTVNEKVEVPTKTDKLEVNNSEVLPVSNSEKDYETTAKVIEENKAYFDQKSKTINGMIEKTLDVSFSLVETVIKTTASVVSNIIDFMKEFRTTNISY